MDKIFPIHPVAGQAPDDTQHQDDELEFMSMPKGMQLFSMPEVPENADQKSLRAATAILKVFWSELKQWEFERYAQGPLVDLKGVDANVLKLLSDVLCAGEVSAILQQKNGSCLHIQESVFTGVWQVKEIDAQGKLIKIWIEAGSFPFIATKIASEEGSAQIQIPEPDLCPEGAMNVQALFVEIGNQLDTFQTDRPAHVINLTLLPLSPADHQLLAETIAPGGLAVTSRSYGSCKVHSTSVAHVWRVLYFNNNEALILNTLEVVTVPGAIQAAKEDIEDSVLRLDELLGWMEQSLGEKE